MSNRKQSILGQKAIGRQIVRAKIWQKQCIAAIISNIQQVQMIKKKKNKRITSLLAGLAKKQAGFEYTIKDLSLIDDQQRESISLALELNLITQPTCFKCSKLMKLGVSKQHINSCCWRCLSSSCNQRRQYLQKDNKLFKSTKLNMSSLLKLYLLHLPIQDQYISINNSLDISKYDLTKARKVWTEVLKHHYLNYFSHIQLRDTGQVVEIDESVFSRKYNRGRLLRRQQWVLGLTERDQQFNRTVLIPIAKRDKETLIPLIKQFVSKKSKMICTDKWRGYSSLKSEGYNHHSVNHSKNFVEPKNTNQKNKNKRNQNRVQNYKKVKGQYVHTQTIENRWRHLKERLRKLRGKRVNYWSDVYQSLFYLLYRKSITKKSIELYQQYMLNPDNEDI